MSDTAGISTKRYDAAYVSEDCCDNGEGGCWCDDWGDDYQSPESDPAFYIQRVGFAGNPAGGGIFHTRSEADAGRYVSELLYSARNGDMVTVEISL